MSFPNQSLSEGLAHQQRGEFAQAEKKYRQVLQKDPKHAVANQLMGLLDYQRGAYAAAERQIRKAMALDQNMPDFHANLGEVLRIQGRMDEAIAVLSAAAKRFPSAQAVWHTLGFAYLDARRPEEAIGALRTSLGLNPNFQGYYLMGKALLKLKRHADAVEALRKGVLLNPKSAVLMNTYGIALCGVGRLRQSMDAYAAAIALAPGEMGTACCSLANCAQILGEHERAMRFFRQAMATDAGQSVYRSNFLLGLLYLPEWSPEAVFAEHLLWDEQFGRPKRVFSHGSIPSDAGHGGRRLRVGYVSEDFCAHVVAYFFESIAKHHDHERHEIFMYSDVELPDDTTHRLQAMADQWRPTVGMSNDEMADQIHKDQIDILVDLGGHTGGGRRLGVFAQKPAPIQATYLGYANTTGLKAMDYRIVDAQTDPVGQTERYHTESLMRLPGCFLCYTPLADSPEIGPSPCAASGQVTFVSFNNFAKVSEAWVAQTARILAAVPGSKCMIKSLFFQANDGSRERIVAMFAAHGIGEDRLILLAKDAGQAEHLARYNTADIALDTFPYNGTTTTCEALWMGVPVVTLAGETHVSRVGASLMAAVGLPELVATTPDDYVRIAVALANQPAKLRELRESMRRRMQPLTDGKAFAAKLEAAYSQMAAMKTH